MLILVDFNQSSTYILIILEEPVETIEKAQKWGIYTIELWHRITEKNACYSRHYYFWGVYGDNLRKQW